MTEIERLERRLESWRKVRGPRWLLNFAPKTIAELEAQIAELKREQKP